MKKLILLCTVFFTTLTWGKSLTSKSLGELIEAIEKEDFIYKGRGKLFSFNSTQSCLFVSENMAIFKNYCYPVRKYPARGYTVISRDFGMIDIYEEALPGFIKRDVSITEFPELLTPYLSTPLPEMTLTGLDALMEKIYNQYNPGCWSTNFSFYTETEDANCSINTGVVQGFSVWARETQTIVADEAAWNLLYKNIDSKLR